MPRKSWTGSAAALVLAVVGTISSARADDVPPGLLGKWGAQGAADGCKANYFTITADGGISVVEADGGPRRIMTFTIDGTMIVVNNAGHLEKAPFKIDGTVLILNPATPQENRYTRCAS